MINNKGRKLPFIVIVNIYYTKVDKMNFSEVLKSKPHNPHYLNRYIKFIATRAQITIHETHHICPKAKDLFPEYADLKSHKWNSIGLSYREHILAHVMLWKAYGGSQALALQCMLKNFTNNTNTLYTFRRVPTCMVMRYFEQCKTEANVKRKEYNKGKSTYKDSSGNKYFLHKDDPLVQELNLVGNNTGLKMTAESKQSMSDSKLPNKKVKIYFLDNMKRVTLRSEECIEMVAQGWTYSLTLEDRQYIKQEANKKVSSKLKNKSNYATPDGMYYGKLSKDDPLIQELKLKPYITDGMKTANKTNVKYAIEANIGTFIYNNGIEEAKFTEDPEDKSWKRGRLPRTTEHDNNQKRAASSANANTIYWNNGVKMKRFKKGVIPDGEEWVKGMLPRKPKF